MPPKGSEVTKLPEFVVRTGPDEVCCNACGNGIIKRRNLARHLETASHKDSFRVYEAQQRASAVDQLRQSNPVGLNPPLPSHSLTNPSPAASGSMPSDTWHLDTNGINTSDYSDIQFSAGESENLGLPLLMRSMGVNQATEVTRTPPEVEDDEFSMPLPQRILRSLAAEELNVEELQTRFAGLKKLANWCPYESKIMFLLDLLDNIPRLRLSAEHLRLIMWVMEEAGCSDMPKFSRLRQVQQELRTVCAITSHQYRSSQGNFFEMLDIPQLIGRDFSNPLVAPHLVFYPEDSGNRLSESWQAKKWRDEVPLEHLTPMYADGGKTYYVNELARLHNGAYVIPRRWITREGQLTADCWPVNWQSVPGNEEETRLQVSEDIIHVPSNAFASNYYDLIEHMDPASYRFTGTLKDVRALAWHKYAHIEHIGVVSKSFGERMPNPLRKLAGDAEELVSCFIKPWCDDVSGGRTKQYQPHNNIYIMHANLPGSFLNQEFSVRFTSTATHASSTEQFEAIKEQLE
ncbi:hypothetical protein FS749_002010 [Ceratobasidium sp. UAMH 11750]|nr:hypothetical protein FS749_002010 [Ceratobasidium sp. UAMH 11750]